MIDLNEFGKQSLEVAKTRQKNGGKIDIKEIPMLKHCATEVIEATEAYLNYIATDNEENYNAFASELADIMSCCIIIATQNDVDLEKALQECYERNKLRSELKGDKL